jgi:antitoxin (DNA-binding transcriptional repressor) of toxin-antitoxin stability system
MRIIEKMEATAPLTEYATGVKKEPVIVTRRGKPIAALVSIENADLETVSLSTNRRFLELIERSRARQRAEGGISSGEMRRRLDVKKTGKA